jgi:3-phenylpropionate/trans-cinnamate dioxygenase ferredoxin reductase subunit
MADFDVVIVGAGHAGAQAAAILRQMHFPGSIALVGDEPHLPYERPPLSKGYLLGEKAFEQTLLRSAGFWEKADISLLLGKRAVEVRPSARTMRLEDGSQVGYGQLLWATGGAPRTLCCPGGDRAGVRTLRTRADIDLLLASLPSIETIAIVGGGYIGLEAASALTKLGKEVTIIEALDRVLSRVAGCEISEFVEAKHQREGVVIRTSTNVAAIDCASRGFAVLLDSGERIVADLVIVGIGIAPAVGPLLDAGASGHNGIDVDEYCRTTLDGIYAIGDCAAHPNPFARGKRVRLESVQNANDQAKTAVHHLIGDPRPYHAVPWFWSHQFDIKLQTVGLSQGHDRTEVSGDPSSGRFSVSYFQGAQLIAVDCVNSPKAFVEGRTNLTAAFATCL